MENTLIITDENFQEVMAQPGKIAIDVWAEWCGPCKRSTPVFFEIAETMESENFKFAKLDAQNQRVAAQAMKVMNLPTFVLFKDGQLIKKWAGADIGRLRKELDEFNKL